MHISDRIKHNGKDYLSLDQTTDTWVALDPQAVFLKKELDRDSERTVRDRMCFQEACTELMKDLNQSYSASKGGNVVHNDSCIIALIGCSVTGS